ncbi:MULTISPECIES: CpsD/CapB family tyrosine-protein kinase [Lactobacillales]|uniref:CpsD/CapB family tyrosine-protein kinase n=1 Tax=Lactobacillales TaxID=186826 RepID=UPI0009E543D8|nr:MULTISPECIES: CpsD/CapB family tyrosine-protein kinase [unclassified Carnobacterium]KAF3300158.1 polysaccharide biosynthesis tyrosine autokinase [Carnobacterium sp. PL26RED25]KAF3302147.1 polysaccharide biosynthesis tyrosine autokinase [Carnobacterium sp. PL12RED10]KAF3304803.1 polysaccharide biosynthesis tyrosine autokinase [Carnobacterium sp. PL24RED07]KAF3305083.1 polysaccharide biosynthesis tyrosine autokinase [Carnobacterium sp. PL17GRE32]
MFKNKRKHFDRMNAEQRRGASLITVTQPNDVISESFRQIRTNIQFSMVDRDFKSIMFTSSGGWEGKSTVTANTAAVMAQQGLRVLLVDADLRKPTVAKTFNINTTVGLTSLLTDRDANIMDTVNYVADANIYILAAGPIPPNPSELLGSNRMAELIGELEEMFDLVIFDTPPILAVTDAQVVATRVDGVIVVVRSGIANKNEVRKTKDLLDVVNANVIGAVYNGEDANKLGYGYGYGYGYGQSETSK